MDSKTQLIHTYNKIASAYSNARSKQFYEKEFSLYQNYISGKKIIDLGCGEGRDAEIFLAHDFDYTGIDFSEGMLKLAKTKNPHGKFLKRDFKDTGFPNETFDGFWAAASFLHVPKENISKVLAETKRITKVGGVGFISMKEKIDQEEGIIHEEKYGGIDRYFAYYDLDEFKEILEKNNFSILHIRNHDEKDARGGHWLCFFVKAK